MRKRYIIMFAVGAAVLLAAMAFRVPLGLSGLGPILLMALAARGAWSDRQKAERSLYGQRGKSSGQATKYHSL